jgi:hypothetical protein
VHQQANEARFRKDKLVDKDGWVYLCYLEGLHRKTSGGDVHATTCARKPKPGSAVAIYGGVAQMGICSRGGPTCWAEPRGAAGAKATKDLLHGLADDLCGQKMVCTETHPESVPGVESVRCFQGKVEGHDGASCVQTAITLTGPGGECMDVLLEGKKATEGVEGHCRLGLWKCRGQEGLHAVAGGRTVVEGKAAAGAKNGVSSLELQNAPPLFGVEGVRAVARGDPEEGAHGVGSLEPT